MFYISNFHAKIESAIAKCLGDKFMNLKISFMFLKEYENKVILVNLFDFFVVNFCLNYGNYIIVLILNIMYPFLK